MKSKQHVVGSVDISGHQFIHQLAIFIRQTQWPTLQAVQQAHIHGVDAHVTFSLDPRHLKFLSFQLASLKSKRVERNSIDVNCSSTSLFPDIPSISADTTPSATDTSALPNSTYSDLSLIQFYFNAITHLHLVPAARQHILGALPLISYLDLSPFTHLQHLELTHVSPDLLVGLDSLHPQLEGVLCQQVQLVCLSQLLVTPLIEANLRRKGKCKEVEVSLHLASKETQVNWEELSIETHGEGEIETEGDQDSSDLEALARVARLRRLKSLHLESSWPRLKLLDVSHQHLTDLDTTTCLLLTNLTSLHLHHNRFTTIPRGLHYLPLLNQLDMGFNRISNLSCFLSERMLDRLTILNFERNRIQSTEGLQALIALRHLNLSHNQIRDVLELTRLVVLPRLEVLYIAGNPVASQRKIRSKLFSAFGPRPYSFQLDGLEPSLMERLSLRLDSTFSSSSQDLIENLSKVESVESKTSAIIQPESVSTTMTPSAPPAIDLSSHEQHHLNSTTNTPSTDSTTAQTSRSVRTSSTTSRKHQRRPTRNVQIKPYNQAVSHEDDVTSPSMTPVTPTSTMGGRLGKLQNMSASCTSPLSSPPGAFRSDREDVEQGVSKYELRDDEVRTVVKETGFKEDMERGKSEHELIIEKNAGHLVEDLKVFVDQKRIRMEDQTHKTELMEDRNAIDEESEQLIDDKKQLLEKKSLTEMKTVTETKRDIIEDQIDPPPLKETSPRSSSKELINTHSLKASPLMGRALAICSPSFIHSSAPELSVGDKDKNRIAYRFHCLYCHHDHMSVQPSVLNCVYCGGNQSLRELHGDSIAQELDAAEVQWAQLHSTGQELDPNVHLELCLHVLKEEGEHIVFSCPLLDLHGHAQLIVLTTGRVYLVPVPSLLQFPFIPMTTPLRLTTSVVMELQLITHCLVDDQRQWMCFICSRQPLGVWWMDSDRCSRFMDAWMSLGLEKVQYVIERRQLVDMELGIELYNKIPFLVHGRLFSINDSTFSKSSPASSPSVLRRFIRRSLSTSSLKEVWPVVALGLIGDHLVLYLRLFHSFHSNTAVDCLDAIHSVGERKELQRFPLTLVRKVTRVRREWETHERDVQVIYGLRFHLEQEDDQEQGIEVVEIVFPTIRNLDLVLDLVQARTVIAVDFERVQHRLM